MRLAIVTTLSVLLASTVVLAQRFTTNAANEAREAYEEDLAAARKKYADALDEAAKKAVAADDLDEVVRINAVKKSLEGGAGLESKQSPKRELWKHKNGYFEQLNDGFWIERVPNAHAHIFAQGEVNDRYIEISRVTGGRTLVRLFVGHAEFLPPGAQGFRRLYRGRWADK